MAFEIHQTKQQILTHLHADPNNAGLHAYPKMPSLAEWKKDSFVGTIFSPRRLDDRPLIRIDGLVDGFSRAHSGGAALYILAELFFATMWWLDNFKNDPKMDARRRPAILRLNLCAANQVARLLGPCPIGEVASRLKAIYGTGMAQHGHDVDDAQHPHYLTILERERWRVIFRNGLAYGQDSSGAFVPIDTKDEFLDGNREGRGFVMTLSGGLFVAPLGKGVKYHSCFMGGEPILCAGTVALTGGQITQIKNDSGHYQPVDQSLAQVLRRLQFSGVNLSKITVEREEFIVNNQKVPKGSYPGDWFLRANGNWALAQPLRFGLGKVA